MYLCVKKYYTLICYELRIIQTKNQKYIFKKKHQVFQKIVGTKRLILQKKLIGQKSL